MNGFACVVVALSGSCFAAAAATMPPSNGNRIAEIASSLADAPSVCSPDEDFSDDDIRRMLEMAECAVAEPHAPFPLELYGEYYTTGNRTRFQNWRKSFVERFDALCRAEMHERSGRFVAAITAYLGAFAEWPSWTHPSYDGKLSGKSPDVIVIDLLSSDLARRLAEWTSLIGERLPQATVAHVRDEIRRRVLEPYLTVAREISRASGWKRGNWWVDAGNNWNAVCHSECVRAALAALPDRVERAQCVEFAERSIGFFLDGFSADGYCSEGMGYWNYGYGHFLSLGMAVRRATEGKVDFFAHPKAHIPMRYPLVYRLQKGRSPNYADGGGNLRQQVLEWGFRVWPSYRVEFDGELPPRGEFPLGQVWIFRRSDATDIPFSVAIKGGNNAEFHNHNDIGSWTMMFNGSEIAGDPGGEIYTRRTFSKERYQSPVLNSFGHPVPMVGGRLQGTGAAFSAKVISTSYSDGCDSVALDLTRAYDVPALKSLTRRLYFDRTNVCVRITDRVEFSEPTAFDDPIITYRNFETGKTCAEFFVSGDRDANRVVSGKIAAKGGDWRLVLEDIPNPGRPSPKRISVCFSEPVTEAEVSWTFSPCNERE